jgi:peptidoglycan/LPS O-acetylase OafA/YrhL
MSSNPKPETHAITAVQPGGQNPKPFYIRGFDGLRALSILMVVLTHLGVYDALPENSFNKNLLNTITGTVGVTIFFSISGFLITTLLMNEKYRTGTISYKNFIIRRFLRLLPTLIFFYLTVLYLIISGQLDIKYTALLISICYLYNFVPARLYFSELGHTWSLGVEEQFYVFWPLLMLRFRKNRILIIAFVLVILAIIITTIIPYVNFVYKNKHLNINDVFWVHRWFIPAIAPIMIGSAFAVLNFHNEWQLKTRIAQRGSVIIALVFIFAAFITPDAVSKYLFIIQAFGFAILLTYIFNQQSSVFTNFLELKPLAFIGKISYGIYVWQGLFLRTGPGGSLWIQQFPQNISLTLIVAVTSYYTIEKMALKWKQKFKTASTEK